MEKRPEPTVACPVCQKPLSLVTMGEISAGMCQGSCGGLLFKGLVYKRLFQVPATILEPLQAVRRDATIQVDRRTKLNCPCCRQTRMMQSFFSQAKQALVNECPRCARVWLNGGELTLAIAEYAAKKERLKQAEKRSEDVQVYLQQQQQAVEKRSVLQRLFPKLMRVDQTPDPQLQRYMEELKRRR